MHGRGALQRLVFVELPVEVLLEERHDPVVVLEVRLQVAFGLFVDGVPVDCRVGSQPRGGKRVSFAGERQGDQQSEGGR